MKSFSSRVRQEFPHGWWRSVHWWMEGVREIGVHMLATFTPLLLVCGVSRAWRHREDPSQLRPLDRTLEGYIGGGLLYGVGLIGLILPGVRESLGDMRMVVTIGLFGWSLLNVAVCLWAMAIIIRSRWTSKVLWSMIDFVEEHSPRNGRVPDTAEEHEAQRLSSSL